MSGAARLPIRFDLGGGYAAGVISGGFYFLPTPLYDTLSDAGSD